MITIAAADLPELLDEYLDEHWDDNFFITDDLYNGVLVFVDDIEEITKKLTDWLFGGKEEEDK
jgi:hypothetical protein